MASLEYNLDIIPTEMCYKAKQDIVYLYIFSGILYTYIFSNLHLSKLSLRATQLTFVCYFELDSYKLLDCKIDSIYSKRNISFKKKITNLTKEL